jgi:phosphoribosyl 1,2-cyclic phosphodiesterase
MEIKVIGSGSSGNAYRVSDGKTTILLDCGLIPAKIQQGCDFKLSDISGALISHQHGDHTNSCKGLERYGMEFYGSKDCFDALGLTSFQYHAIDPLQPFRIGTFDVMAFDVHHDVRNYGYYIHSIQMNENLVYVTDTYYVSETFPNLNYIMFECNYSLEAVNESIAKGYIPEALKHRLLSSHMSLDHFIDMLKANDLSNVRAVYLLHLSDNNSREAEFKEAVQRAAGCPVYIA